MKLFSRLLWDFLHQIQKCNLLFCMVVRNASVGEIMNVKSLLGREFFFKLKIKLIYKILFGSILELNI